VNIWWEFAERQPHGLARGHVTVRTAAGLVSSKERRPDQSFLLVPTMAQFLDDVSIALDQRAARPRHPFSFRLVAVDSSFVVRFECSDKDVVTVFGPEGRVGYAMLHEVVQAIERAADWTRVA
jgi:hypothetical protein